MMSDKTIKSELALEEKLIEISNELSSDHSKFVEDLYDFDDMWLLCDIVKEFSKRQSERTSEANGEVSPLEGMVSVRDLKELIEMWKESSKIPAMVGESKEVIAAKNIVYAECCRELKRLIDGDKSVIEKI